MTLIFHQPVKNNCHCPLILARGCRTASFASVELFPRRRTRTNFCDRVSAMELEFAQQFRGDQRAQVPFK